MVRLEVNPLYYDLTNPFAFPNKRIYPSNVIIAEISPQAQISAIVASKDYIFCGVDIDVGYDPIPNYPLIPEPNE